MGKIKRAYEPPEPADGRRLLVKRLWPRSVKKEALAADAWVKDFAEHGAETVVRAPAERWEEFRRRYRDELAVSQEVWAPILDAARRGPVTLLYSAHDTEHNGALVLREACLAERGQRRAPRTVRNAARVAGGDEPRGERRSGWAAPNPCAAPSGRASHAVTRRATCCSRGLLQC